MRFEVQQGDSNSKNTSDDVDEVYFSLPKFMKMAAAGETIAIDMLHCNDKNLLESSETWKFLHNNRSKFYTKNMKSFLGYCKKQASKYNTKGSRLRAMEDFLKIIEDAKGQEVRTFRLDTLKEKVVELAKNSEFITVSDYFYKGDKKVEREHVEVCGSKYDFTTPLAQVYLSVKTKYDAYGHRAQQAKENKGIDWKAVSHAIRAAYQLKEIYETGDLKYPLKNRDFILKVKLGELDYTTEVAPVLEALIEEVQGLAYQSNYPEMVDKSWCESVVLHYLKSQ